MPRIPIVSADWRASNVATRNDGTAPSARSYRLWTWRSVSAWLLSTLIAIGVFCRFVSRLVAVTTISPRPVWSAGSAVAGGRIDHGVCGCRSGRRILGGGRRGGREHWRRDRDRQGGAGQQPQAQAC
ncbi:hypothetical protein [Sphingomonas sp. H160509]|uniref:hypothetical protein n=1 Tax=Sphingomonas sp. H160509 TaxID=2955313 RepID=UPI00406CAE0A